MQTTLKVTGMNCGACVRHVTNALQGVIGVEQATVDLAAGRATVRHDESVTTDQLIEAVDEEGYEASVLLGAA
jgi:copper chaperone